MHVSQVNYQICETDVSAEVALLTGFKANSGLGGALVQATESFDILAKTAKKRLQTNA
jgi:hypothetical protein